MTTKIEQITSCELGIEFALTHEQTQVANEGEAASSGPPTEFLLIPDVQTIAARDGRVFRVHDREQLLQAFTANNAELPIDINHNEFSWNSMVDRRAYGWIGGLEAVGQYGVKATKVTWTKLGVEALSEKFYRYISGAFAVSWLEEADGTDVALITKVLNAGLVNRGAMVLPALAGEQLKKPGESAGETMTPKILQVLGLQTTATEAQACEAIALLQQRANAGVNPLEFAPIADYRAALARAETAETALKAVQLTALATEAKAEIDQAVTQGKVPPSMRPAFEVLCSTREGLNAFKTNMATVQPVIANTSYLSGGVRPPETPVTTGQTPAGVVALTAADREMAAKIGVSEEEFAKSKQQIAGGKRQ
jgi:phage I-like protein